MFLNQLKFPLFSEEDKINLDKNLCTEELLEAPKSVNNGKAYL